MEGDREGDQNADPGDDDETERHQDSRGRRADRPVSSMTWPIHSATSVIGMPFPRALEAK